MADSPTPSMDGIAIQVGEMLRNAREARGESVAEAAGFLKLTTRQVEAMETGRYDLLPGPAFVRGFLRNYARHLGVDPSSVMGAIERPAEPAVDLAPVSNADGVVPVGTGSRRSVAPFAAVAVLLVLVMLAGWYFDWFKADPGGAPAAAPERPATEEVPVVPPAAPPAGQPSGAVDLPPPQAIPPAAPASAPGALAAPPAAAPVPPAVAVPPANPGEGVVAQEVATVPSDGASRIQLRFDGEAWVEVRDASGRILHSGINRAGSTRAVQGQAPLSLVVGNAGQVHLDYNGAAVDLAPHTRVNVARLTLK